MEQYIKCPKCKGWGKIRDINVDHLFNNAAWPMLLLMVVCLSIGFGGIFSILLIYVLPFFIWDLFFFLGGISMIYIVFFLFKRPLFTTNLWTIVIMFILCFIGVMNAKYAKVQYEKKYDSFLLLYCLFQTVCIGIFYITFPVAEFNTKKCPVCHGAKEIFNSTNKKD